MRHPINKILMNRQVILVSKWTHDVKVLEVLAFIVEFCQAGTTKIMTNFDDISTTLSPEAIFTECDNSA